MTYSDIDGVECDREGQPLAIIELKHGAIKEIDLSSLQIKLMVNMANGLNIPFLIVRYFMTGEDAVTKQVDRYGKDNFFQVFAGNQQAESILKEYSDNVLSERQYVELLYKIRNEKMPEGLALGERIGWGHFEDVRAS